MNIRLQTALQMGVEEFQFNSTQAAAMLLGEPVPDEKDIAALVDFTCRLEAFLRVKKADALLAELAK